MSPAKGVPFSSSKSSKGGGVYSKNFVFLISSFSGVGGKNFSSFTSTFSTLNFGAKNLKIFVSNLGKAVSISLFFKNWKNGDREIKNPTKVKKIKREIEKTESKSFKKGKEIINPSQPLVFEFLLKQNKREEKEKIKIKIPKKKALWNFLSKEKKRQKAKRKIDGKR
jgi:hypothetical protein